MSYFLKYQKYKKKYLKQKDLQIGASSQKCVYNEKHDIMENVCPGLKYFNEIKDDIEKNPDAIYIIFGHGCDLDCELLIVPENCRYITRVACGIASFSSRDDINIGNDFLNNTLDIRRLNKYEWVINSNEHDVVYFEEYKTHVSGQNYVNNKNSCFLDKDYGHGGLSGLRRLGDPIISIPKLKNFNFRPEADRFTLREYLLMCYKGSLFPTTQQINKLLDETSIPNSHEKLAIYDWNGRSLKEWEELITANFSIDYASIMGFLPGTFINKACRPICKGKDKTKQDFIGTTPFIQLARKNSDRKIYTELPKEIQEKIDEYSEVAPMPISFIKEDLKKLDNP